LKEGKALLGNKEKRDQYSKYLLPHINKFDAMIASQTSSRKEFTFMPTLATTESQSKIWLDGVESRKKRDHSLSSLPKVRHRRGGDQRAHESSTEKLSRYL
jgi:hypothetical protein